MVGSLRADVDLPHLLAKAVSKQISIKLIIQLFSSLAVVILHGELLGVFVLPVVTLNIVEKNPTVTFCLRLFNVFDKHVDKHEW